MLLYISDLKCMVIVLVTVVVMMVMNVLICELVKGM
jgi:hypothetical protein